MSCLKITVGLSLLVCFLFLGISIGAVWWFYDVTRPVQVLPGNEVCFRVVPGMSAKGIANTLKKAGLIQSSFAFTQLVSFYGVTNRLRPGDYVFQGTISSQALIHELLAGNKPGIKVTIPEGFRLTQISQILDEQGICSASAFLETVSAPELLDSIFATYGALPTAEGLVFPETYVFRKGESPKVVATIMLQLGKHKIDAHLGSSEKDFGLTIYQRCILASIVEREAKLDSERAKVAAVFLNRIKKGIRLESCATDQYALPSYKTRLTYEDLKVKSPYNTYSHVGLPPTPISNFGEASLKAVAQPEESEFFYFVSDAEGGHRFSKTLEEHERSRREFFRKRKKNKDSR